MEKTGKPGTDEQRERNEGDLRRDAGGQESIQPDLQRQTEKHKEEQHDEEEEEGEALILSQFMPKEQYQICDIVS